MEIKEIEQSLKKAGINKTVEELLDLSEDDLFILLGELAEKEGLLPEDELQ